MSSHQSINFDVVVIGGGVIGLSIAKYESEAGKNVVVLEQGPYVGMETSSRNSEVIHAGIYYKTDTLKHKLCIDGRNLLYQYLNLKNIAHKKCGKLIFSTNYDGDEILDDIKNQAFLNGVELQLVAKNILHEYAGLCSMSNALLSNETGIFDSHNFIKSLETDIQISGSIICLNTKVDHLEPSDQKINLFCSIGNEKFIIKPNRIYNAAGLNSLNIAKKISPEIYGSYDNFYVKGHYYSYKKKLLLERLLYPIPDKLGLGVHLTFDLSGNIRFGPDTYEQGLNYSFKNEISDESFFQKVKQNFNGIKSNDISPAYTGIRPKIKNTNGLISDFMIEKNTEYSMVHLLGIESPGLTSSLAIAKYAIDLIE